MAKEVEGAEVRLLQVPELLSDEVIAAMGATETKKTFAHVPTSTLDELKWADAVIFGTPTRFGDMTA